ncbi:hypothetical protein LTR29_015658 [Friedmanniomyces endolithicus]|nr:hypothetical protein LTR29_015658 [Friedmanniomyces endolithicus]
MSAPDPSTSDPTINTRATPAPMARLPEIHLLCMLDEYTTAFTDAVARHCPDLPSFTQITHHNCALKYLPQDQRFDAVVSPANSYARLDGAFDDALARVYGPPGDYDWITRKAQKVVYEQWRRFAPPGTCTVVPLDHKDAQPSGAMGWGGKEPKNPWGTEYLLLCPTMRMPSNVVWDREVVYECVWSLLCAVDNHNDSVRRRNRSLEGAADPGRHSPREIRSILMTPLATGVGRCVIAMKHYAEAVANPEVWGKLSWDKASEDHEEVVETYKNEI